MDVCCIRLICFGGLALMSFSVAFLPWGYSSGAMSVVRVDRGAISVPGGAGRVRWLGRNLISAHAMFGELESGEIRHGLASGVWPLSDSLAVLAHQAGGRKPANLVLSTWAADPDRASDLMGLAESGAVSSVRWLLDPSSASSGSPSWRTFTRRGWDAYTRLIKDHAKFMVLYGGDGLDVLVVCSSNLDTAHRIESYWVFADSDIVGGFVEDVLSVFGAGGDGLVATGQGDLPFGAGGRRSDRASDHLAGMEDREMRLGLSGGEWSLIDGVREVIDLAGPGCSMGISTWSAGHAHMNRLLDFLESGSIGDLRLVVDKAFTGGLSSRAAGILRESFPPGTARVARSHLKFVYALPAPGKPGVPVLLTTSANLSQNPRAEDFVIVASEDLVMEYVRLVDDLWAVQDADVMFDRDRVNTGARVAANHILGPAVGRTVIAGPGRSGRTVDDLHDSGLGEAARKVVTLADWAEGVLGPLDGGPEKFRSLDAGPLAAASVAAVMVDRSGMAHGAALKEMGAMMVRVHAAVEEFSAAAAKKAAAAASDDGGALSARDWLMAAAAKKEMEGGPPG